MLSRITCVLSLALASAAAQPQDPAYQPLERAYQALRDKNYDQAIAGFKQGIALAPARASIRKDLAYTLLKVGENEAARDQFGEAMRLDPADQHVALEYAFLCYETKQQALARHIFDRVRKTGEGALRQTAEQPSRILTSRSPRGLHAGKRWRNWSLATSARTRNSRPWPSSAMH